MLKELKKIFVGLPIVLGTLGFMYVIAVLVSEYPDAFMYTALALVLLLLSWILGTIIIATRIGK